MRFIRFIPRHAGRIFLRIFNILLLCVAGLVLCAVLLWAALLHSSGTPEGRAWLGQKAGQILSGPGREVTMGELGGLPFAVEIANLSLADEKGVWLTAKKAVLAPDLASFVRNGFSWLNIEEISLDAPHLARLPQTAAEPQVVSLPPEQALKNALALMANPPHWLPVIALNNIRVTGLELGQPVLTLVPAFLKSLDYHSMSGNMNLTRLNTGITVQAALELPFASLSAKVESHKDHTLSARMVAETDNLAAFHPALAGEARVNLRLEGEPFLPRITLDVQGVDISVSGQSFDRATLHVNSTAVHLADWAKPSAAGELTASTLQKGENSRLFFQWTADTRAVALTNISAQALDASARGHVSLVFDQLATEGQFEFNLNSGKLAQPFGYNLKNAQAYFNWNLLLNQARNWRPVFNLPAPPLLPPLPQGSHFLLAGTVEDLTGPDISIAQAGFSIGQALGKPAMALTLQSENGKVGQFAWTKLGLLAQAAPEAKDGLTLDAFVEGENSGGIKAAWSPRLLALEQLHFEHKPMELGINLAAPARIELPETGLGLNVAAPGLRLNVLPQGTLTLAGTWNAQGSSAHLQAIADAEFSAWQALVPALPAGRIKATLALKGTPASPEGKASLTLTGIILPRELLQTLPNLPPELLKGIDATLNATLAPASHGAILSANATLPALKAFGLNLAQANLVLPLNLSPQGVPSLAKDRPLSANLALDGRLGPLWRLLPLADRRLSGSLSLTAALSGTLAAPIPRAALHIDKAHYLDLPLGLEITDINSALTLAENSLHLTLSAADGRKGSLEISGNLALPSLNPEGFKQFFASSVSVQGSLSAFAPLRRSDISILLSGDMAASGPLSSPLLAASLTLDEGEIRIDSLPGSSVPVLPVELANNAPPSPSSSPSFLSAARLNASLTIPRRLFVRGRGLESEWQGTITATGSPFSPSLAGQLNSVRGNLDFMGRQFVLSTGLVSFGGGFMPMLNIVMACRVSSSFTASVNVSGPADGPTLVLTSEPALPRDEILSQILFGQSGQKLNQAQALQLAGAAAALAGLGNGGGLVDFSRRLLGVDTLRLTSQESADGKSVPSVEIGKYLFDNVYVGAEQGLDASSSGVRVDIELYPGIDLEGRTTGRGSEIGVQWKKDY